MPNRHRRTSVAAVIALVAATLAVAPVAGAAPPANDDFASATAIASLPFTDSTTTVDATIEGGEPSPSCGTAVTGSVWYSFTPATNLTLFATNLTADRFTEQDQVIAVYRQDGSGLGGLTEVACSSVINTNPEHVGWGSLAAATYYVQVAGLATDPLGAVDFQMGRAGTISGTITDSVGGAVLGGVQVRAYDGNGRYMFSATQTTGAGGYTLSYVPVSSDPSFGQTRLEIRPAGIGLDGYPVTWYDGAVAFGLATPVTVNHAATTPVSTTITENGGAVEGTVSDLAGGVLDYSIDITLLDATGAHEVQQTSSDAFDGTYGFDRLPPAAYTIKYEKGAFSPIDYITEWYDDQPDPASADQVVVPASTTVTGIDAMIAQPQGWIEGTITEDGTGQPLEGIRVSVLDPSTYQSLGTAFTGPDGSFTKFLDPGDYKLQFTGDDQITEYYDDTDRDNADVVTVVSLTGVSTDASLAPGASIVGTVTDARTGDPVAGAEAIAYQGATVVAGGATQADGSYRIQGLDAGTYTLFFSGNVTDYVDEWWDDTDPAGADPIVLTTGQQATGYDAALDSAAISGTVTSNGGAAADVTVTVRLAGAVKGIATTASNGTYTVSGLGTGGHTVEFSDPTGDHVGEWWDDTDQGGADVVTITTPTEDVLAIDALLTAACLGVPATIEGTGGPDTLVGTSGKDVIVAFGGDDTLSGLGDNDLLCGGPGADTLDGGPGDDDLSGGDGPDTATFASAPSGIVASLAAGIAAGDGSDTLEGIENLTGSGFDDALTGNGAANTILGRDGDDRIIGVDGDDDLQGGGGNDTLYGGDGDDTLSGGPDDDLLKAGDGDDAYDGNSGSDTASFFGAPAGVTADLVAGTATGEGTDSLVRVENLTGSGFDDILTGDFGSNTIDGGEGDDLVQGLGGDDVLHGGPGDDEIVAANGDDTLDGQGGADVLKGGRDDDTITGGSGDDVLQGGPGNDTLDGNSGADEASFSGSAAAVVVDLLAGSATGEGTDTLALVEHVTGSGHDDTITGDMAGNVIEGRAGADTVYGKGGADTITGGSGADLLIGDGADDVIEGQGGNDELQGRAGDDTLSGGADDDVLLGGEGDDTLDGNAGSDVASYAGAALAVIADLLAGIATGEGTDTLTNLEDLIGSPNDDTLTGDHDANTIEARGGDDTLFGLGGDDLLDGGAGTDTADGGGGADICTAETTTAC